MPTKREFDAVLNAFLHPEPKSIDAALASADPVGEIARRLLAFGETGLSPTEQLFLDAMLFHGDTLNGGLYQTLTNSTGGVTHAVARFSKEYCSPQIADLLEELIAMFPAGHVPTDRDVRSDLVNSIAPDEVTDPFDELTTRFYALEEEFMRGLLAFVVKNKHDFPHIHT